VDEEFEALFEYVKHQLLGKVIMGLKTTWKERRAQKINEYVN
jgi:hypothetical protein